MSAYSHSYTLPFNQYRTHHTDLVGLHRLRRRFLSLVSHQIHRPHVLLCLGSNRSTGDSLGPLTGTKIAAQTPSNIEIFGTLDNPVHARNLEQTLFLIQDRYIHPFIIALDATLGCRQSVGFITLSFGPLRPGSALKKHLPPVGDIHLTGVVNVNRLIQSLILHHTPLDLVWNISDFFLELFASIPYYQILKP